MGKKAAKSMKKFALSGQLKKTIDARRKHQQIKRKNNSKKSIKDGKAKQRPEQEEEVEEDEESPKVKAPAKGCGTVASARTTTLTPYLARKKA
jgi:nucleolar complex protein 2